MTMSYQWSSTSAAATFNLYLRSSGGWLNAFRPKNGYGLEFTNTSGTASLRKVVNGTTTTTLASAAAAQQVSTGRQWVRLRVVGTTIQAKFWSDGSPEPVGWTISASDSSVASPGSLVISAVRNAGNSGPKAVSIDDVALFAG